MSDGAWLDVDEVEFEHSPEVAEWMREAGAERARVSAARQVEGHRWVLLECAPEEGEAIAFRALAMGEHALKEDESVEWLEALGRMG